MYASESGMIANNKGTFHQLLIQTSSLSFYLTPHKKNIKNLKKKKTLNISGCERFKEAFKKIWLMFKQLIKYRGSFIF